ncbi:hypothetical protein EF878_21085 [Dickeya undicola]|uniref:Uncharacterized protein n=1 Tax=Dickeya undicola TaxID=1577887 RepID=A0A3N0FJG3_9GAMM|nr:hypothetical protein EF878_21085 [Dickeya undicola]
MSRYKAQMSLALKGQRFALFKTQYVLSCNSNYLGYTGLRYTAFNAAFSCTRIILDIVLASVACFRQ